LRYAHAFLARSCNRCMRPLPSLDQRCLPMVLMTLIGSNRTNFCSPEFLGMMLESGEAA